ncbi:MAG TPA: HAMP domain-containing sensor histidine kinase [Rhodanobacteraceae bacterium]|nr:HAMP domain-containing sensor histidine kinase [Rhodanobacteraceae bacterium]
MNQPVSPATEDTGLRSASRPDAGIARVIGDLAHELVNPLNAAAMSTELAKLMLSRGQYDRAAEAIDRIGGDCMRCARILRDAQDYLTVAINPAQGEIDPIVPLEEASKMLSDRGEIASDAAPGTFSVRGDPTALRRMFTELLRNAFDHGANRVEIHAVREGDSLHIRVSDNGPGIQPVHLPRVFDPFFSTKRDQHSGVGLAIARRIAQAHGGDLTVEGSAAGAVFQADLPL